MNHFGVFLVFWGEHTIPARHVAGPTGEHLLGEHWSSICEEPSCPELANLDPDSNWLRWAGSSIKLHSRGHWATSLRHLTYPTHPYAATVQHQLFSSLGPLTAWSFGFERQPNAGAHESEGESMLDATAVTSHPDSKPVLLEVAKAGLQ